MLWSPIPDGGFQRLEEHLRRPQKTIVKPRRKPRASADKADKRAGAKKTAVEYFVDHCENTQCSLRPGHTGLCSHQLVAGKRGGRVGRSLACAPVAASPPVARDFVFDLNDSDSDS